MLSGVHRMFPVRCMVSFLFHARSYKDLKVRFAKRSQLPAWFAGAAGSDGAQRSGPLGPTIPGVRRKPAATDSAPLWGACA